MSQVDPRDMLNNFCFHVYAWKSLFIGENSNAFLFWDISLHHTLPCEFRVHRAGSQLKRDVFLPFYSANFQPDMSISVHCRSRRDLEIRDLVRFSCCFLGKSTITVLRFKLQYTKNINLDQISEIFTENLGLELYFPKSREIFPKFPSRDLNLNPIHDLNHDLV